MATNCAWIFRQAFQALRRGASHGLTWRAGSTWIGVVGNKLSSWGFQWQGPWTFRSSDGRSIHLTRDNERQVLHQVREAWRAHHWQCFLQKGRRDSLLLAHVPWQPQRFKIAQKYFDRSNGHGRAALTGAAVSLAVSEFAFEGHARQGCDLCGRADVFPDWEHLTWQCSRFQQSRPRAPDDILQRRLGWPQQEADYDEFVFRRLTEVRTVVCLQAPTSRNCCRF